MTGFWHAVVALSALTETANFGLLSRQLECRLDGSIRICTFSSPGNSLERRHFRLETDCAGPVRVNGGAVTRDLTGWPVSGMLRTDQPNQVVLPAGCPKPTLLITPRVFAIAGFEPGSGAPSGVLLVNTLDNTTNVALEVSLRGLNPFTWSGTLRPDEQRLIEFNARDGWESILLWKAAEAVEDSYYFRLENRPPVL